ncbi:MAG: MoaD/ThiS family protein [Oscillospiraceae bacterium]|nr:MoaD/ThiS family protein [Oscillospiraceae bacterium]
MKINVHFYCSRIVGKAREGEYEVPEGADIAAVMQAAADENGTFIEDYMKYLTFVRNSKAAPADTVLSDGDRLTVLMQAYGG